MFFFFQGFSRANPGDYLFCDLEALEMKGLVVEGFFLYKFSLVCVCVFQRFGRAT
jgi:hypothetical protein